MTDLMDMLWNRIENPKNEAVSKVDSMGGLRLRTAHKKLLLKGTTTKEYRGDTTPGVGVL